MLLIHQMKSGWQYSLVVMGWARCRRVCRTVQEPDPCCVDEVGETEGHEVESD